MGGLVMQCADYTQLGQKLFLVTPGQESGNTNTLIRHFNLAGILIGFLSNHELGRHKQDMGQATTTEEEPK